MPFGIEVAVARMTALIACASDRKGEVELAIVAAQVSGLGDRSTRSGARTLAAHSRLVRADGYRCGLRRQNAAHEDAHGECKPAAALEEWKRPFHSVKTSFS